MVFAISGLFLIISLFLSNFFYKRIFFNPLVIFFAIWFFNFFLYELDTVFQLFYVRLSQSAEILFVLSFFSFFIGALTIAIHQLKDIQNPKVIRPIQIKNFHLRSIYKITKILLPFFLIGVAYKYFLLFQRYGNPFVSLGIIREETVGGEFGYPVFLYFFTLLGYLIIINLGILIVFLKKRKIIIFLTLLAIAAAFFNDATVAGRGSTLNSGLFLISTAMIAYMISGKKLRVKHYLAVVTTLVAIIFLLTTILYLRSDRSIGFFERFIKDSYIYIVGTIPSFSFFVDNPWPANLPLFYTLGGIYKLFDTITGAFGFNFLSVEDLQTYYAPITRIGPFNASGHLAYYYSDLREIGVVVFSYLLGLISSFLFFKAIYNRRILDVQLFALPMSYIIFSIRGVMTGGPSFWVTLILIVLQYLALRYYIFLISPKKRVQNQKEILFQPLNPQKIQ